MTTSRKSAFTLVEMMTVILIIAIVASITMACAEYLFRNARRNRARTTCQALEVALTKYRHEYKEWPGIPSSVDDDDQKVIFMGSNNKEVFGPLRENHAGNTKHIRFIDESALLTTSKFDGPTSSLRETSASSAQPLAYRAPASGRSRYFRVTINLDDDTATVSMDDENKNQTVVEKRDD